VRSSEGRPFQIPTPLGGQRNDGFAGASLFSQIDHTADRPTAHTTASVSTREGSTQRDSGALRRTRALSTSNVERAVGLPRGAWKSRRLFALRVRSAAYRESSIHPGDHLIVEPGAQVGPDRIVVVRDGSALALRRVRLDATGRSVLGMVDPSTLPFAERPNAGREHVIGRVIAVLPAGRLSSAVRDGAIEPLGRRRPTPDSQPRRAAMATRGHGASRRTRSQDLAAVDAWAAWSAKMSQRAAGDEAVLLYDLTCELRTLRACMATTTDEHLYEALLAEARRVASKMRVRSPSGRDRHGTGRHAA